MTEELWQVNVDDTPLLQSFAHQQLIPPPRGWERLEGMLSYECRSASGAARLLQAAAEPRNAFGS